MKQVPEKLTAYTVFRNGTDLLGTADVTLPSFEALSDTYKGAGIAGEIDSPTVGMFGSMTCTLNWRTIESSAARAFAPISHALDFRGNLQNYDTGSGTYRNVPVRVSIRGVPKKFDLGKMEQSATMDSSNDFEVTYIKVMIDGRTMIELDKLNFIYIVDGIDYLAAQRANLGL